MADYVTGAKWRPVGSFRHTFMRRRNPLISIMRRDCSSSERPLESFHLAPKCLSEVCSDRVSNRHTTSSRRSTPCGDGTLSPSRAYTHLVFVAGIVVVFMLNTQVHQQAHDSEAPPETDIEHWIADLDDESCNPTSEETWGSLSTAGDILKWFAEGMPDVAPYTRFFHDLKQGLERVREESHTRQLGSHGREAPGGMGSQGTISQASQMETFFGSKSTYDQQGAPGFCHPAPTEQETVGQSVSMDPAFQPMGVFPGVTHDAGGEGYYDGEHGFGAFSWPFWDVLGMEGFDSTMSGYIWDTIIPWQGSPSLSTETRMSRE